MGLKPQAVLAGYVLGVASIGVGLPTLVNFFGRVVQLAWANFDVPDNPGEAGYVPVFLDWIAQLVSDTVVLFFTLDWFVPNVLKIALLVLGILLLAARPHWLIRLIGRCIT